MIFYHNLLAVVNFSLVWKKCVGIVKLSTDVCFGVDLVQNK